MTGTQGTETDSYERVVSALKNLKRSNTTLEQDCERLRAELSGLNDQKSALDAKLQELNLRRATDQGIELENRELKGRIRDLQCDHEDDVEKLIDLKRVLEQTVVQLCNERKRRARIEAKTAKIAENIRSLAHVAESLQAKPEQLRQNDALSRRIEEKKAKWKQQKQELQSILDSLRSKRDEFAEASKNHQLQVDDRAGLIEQLEAKVERKNKTIAELEQALQERVDEQQRLTADLVAVKAEVEQLATKSQIMKDTLRQSVTNLAASKRKYEKEREKLADTKHRIKNLHVSFAAKLQSIREEAEQETKAKVEELQRLEAQKDDELRKAQEELASANEQHAATESKLKKMEAERQSEKRKYAQAIEEFEGRFQAMQKVIVTFTQRPLCKNGDF